MRVTEYSVEFKDENGKGEAARTRQARSLPPASQIRWRVTKRTLARRTLTMRLRQRELPIRARPTQAASSKLLLVPVGSRLREPKVINYRGVSVA